MTGLWLMGCRNYLPITCVMLVTAGISRAGDTEADLRRQVEEQGRQIEELKRMICREVLNEVEGAMKAKFASIWRGSLKGKLPSHGLRRKPDSLLLNRSCRGAISSVKR